MTAPSLTIHSLTLDGRLLTLRWLRERPGYIQDWCAELDGTPLVVALHEVSSQVGYVDRRWERVERGEAINLSGIAEALADAGIIEAKSGVATDIGCQWGHHRQNRGGHVTLTLTAGLLEIDAQLDEENGSYY